MRELRRRTLRSGTNATFLTRQSNESSCRIVRHCATTWYIAQPNWWRALWFVPNACVKTWPKARNYMRRKRCCCNSSERVFREKKRMRKYKHTRLRWCRRWVLADPRFVRAWRKTRPFRRCFRQKRSMAVSICRRTFDMCRRFLRGCSASETLMPMLTLKSRARRKRAQQHQDQNQMNRNRFRRRASKTKQIQTNPKK